MQSKSKLTLNQIPCGYIATDLKSQITAVNKVLCEWLETSEEELLGKHIGTLMTTSSRMLFLGNILPHLQKNQQIEENYLLLKTKLQDALPVLINCKEILHDNQAYYSYALMKMQRRRLIEEALVQERRRAEMATEEKEAMNLELQLAQKEIVQKQQALEIANAELQALSATDTLTQLPNRRVYERELEKNLALYQRSRQVFSIILFDIDFFKKINDLHGHDIGDLVLQNIAKILTKQLREIDILTRIGGEEFVIILPLTQVDQAKDVAERHRSAIAKGDFVCGKVTASFGVTQVHPDDNNSLLYKRADQALYLAKQNGRNRVEIK
ncbi:hypothetical protein THMIRHAS_11570 [Thiosulfatimonas sediminis]|uniref:diguanylate cyclase n=1 Tax=Thiosulfatimonas sediminis TaxID=2675054 RepID=A0A6F8PUU1_9GAMM|nr:diguanylate cyclase [Thiosulfatimonas sediminis]BBP45784.1 hypothetical protein THMIRHAS_11570 [Thiosulfatimonas sediminis]